MCNQRWLYYHIDLNRYGLCVDCIAWVIAAAANEFPEHAYTMCLFPTCMYTVYTPYTCTAATIPVVLLTFGTPEQKQKACKHKPLRHFEWYKHHPGLNFRLQHTEWFTKAAVNLDLRIPSGIPPGRIDQWWYLNPEEQALATSCDSLLFAMSVGTRLWIACQEELFQPALAINQLLTTRTINVLERMYADSTASQAPSGWIKIMRISVYRLPMARLPHALASTTDINKFPGLLQVSETQAGFLGDEASVYHCLAS